MNIYSVVSSLLFFLFNDFLKKFQTWYYFSTKISTWFIFTVSMPFFFNWPILLKFTFPTSSCIISIFSYKFLNIIIINPCFVILTSGLSLCLLLLTICFPLEQCRVLLLLHISSIIWLYSRYCGYRNSRSSYLPLKSVEFPSGLQLNYWQIPLIQGKLGFSLC